MSNSEMTKARRRLMRDLFAGMAGIFAAAMLVLVTLWMQDYSSPAFLVISLFIFPVPVACGLAVGLVSPRRAIVWAPLWTVAFSLMLFALLPGGVRNIGLAFSSWRLAVASAGIILAALAGWVGEYASKRGYVPKAVFAFLALCAVMAFTEFGVINYRMRVFEREVVPAITARINKDYIALPEGLNWQCIRRPEDGCYLLSTHLNGHNLSVLVYADGPRIASISYKFDDDHKRINNISNAVHYLRDFGFRDAILASLSRQKAGPRAWCASLDGTRLILTSDGCIQMQDTTKFSN